jgi:heat shock protein HtpX
MMASANTLSFVIETEITTAYFDGLMRFFLQQYIRAHEERFVNVKLTVGEDYVLTFTALGPSGKGYVDVELRAGQPIQVKMAPNDQNFPKEAIEQLKEDLVIGVKLFEEQIRRTTLYFAWVEGEEVIPEMAPGRKSIIARLFSESMLVFFIVFMAASIILFAFLGLYAPLALVAIQFAMVLVSDKFIMRTGDWRITERNTDVHLFEYHMPIEEYREFQKKYSRNTLIKIKEEIYKKTIPFNKPIDCETVGEVLSAYGYRCEPGNMMSKRVNVYEIVKKAAGIYGLPMPKIVIANTTIPNAAASGPAPTHGVVLITTGLLVQLNDTEILSVIGHEFSHLRARDPLVLFGITSGEFLLRVYVLWPLVYLFGFLYLFLAFGVIYFIAKFFESRADLEAAIKIGQPAVLAEALEKIGYRRLQFERMPSYRVQEWLGFDPHPPIYFRVARLENLESPVQISHPLIQSIKDNIHGFLAALH